MEKNNKVINDNKISEVELFMLLQNKERLYKLGQLSKRK